MRGELRERLIDWYHQGCIRDVLAKIRPSHFLVLQNVLSAEDIAAHATRIKWNELANDNFDDWDLFVEHCDPASVVWYDTMGMLTRIAPLSYIKENMLEWDFKVAFDRLSSEDVYVKSADTAQ